MASNAAVLLASLNAAALAQRPFTVVRSHLKWIYKSDQTAALEDYGGAVGAAVVTDRASAAGIGSIPNPWANSDSNQFFVYDTFYNQSGAASDLIGATSFIVTDSKAMRKVGPDDDIVFVTEALALNGFLLGVIGRLLILLP